MNRFIALLVSGFALSAGQAGAAETQPILEVRCTGYFLAETANARQARHDQTGSERYRADMLAQAKEAEMLMNVAMDKAFARGAVGIERDVKEIALAYSRLNEQ